MNCFGILEFGDLDIAVQVERQAVCLATLLRSLGKAIERLRQFQVPIVLFSQLPIGGLSARFPRILNPPKGKPKGDEQLAGVLGVSQIEVP